jgi:hypothetical protein
MSAPTPLRQDFDASQVRGLARKTKDADSDDCGHLFRLKADSDSDRSRTAFR